MTGILTDPGIGSTSSVGAISWADLLTALADVEGNNHTPTGYICSPTISNDLNALTSGDGSNSAALWQGPPPGVDKLERFVHVEHAGHRHFDGRLHPRDSRSEARRPGSSSPPPAAMRSRSTRCSSRSLGVATLASRDGGGLPRSGRRDHLIRIPAARSRRELFPPHVRFAAGRGAFLFRGICNGECTAIQQGCWVRHDYACGSRSGGPPRLFWSVRAILIPAESFTVEGSGTPDAAITISLTTSTPTLVEGRFVTEPTA